jgi:hypothetical protein
MSYNGSAIVNGSTGKCSVSIDAPHVRLSSEHPVQLQSMAVNLNGTGNDGQPHTLTLSHGDAVFATTDGRNLLQLTGTGPNAVHITQFEDGTLFAYEGTKLIFSGTTTGTINFDIVA